MSQYDASEIMHHINLRIEEVIRNIGELASRQNHLDGQVAELISRSTAAGEPAAGRGRSGTNVPFPDDDLRPGGALLRSSRTEG